MPQRKVKTANEVDVIIDYSMISDRSWVFKRADRSPSTYHLKFNPDGSIGGYASPNEAFWEIRDGYVCMLNRQKVETVRFTEVKGDPVNAMTGHHIPKPEIILCLELNEKKPRRNNTKKLLAKEIETLGWEIGDHTYGLPGFIEKSLGRRLVIGKYCSIAGGVQIAFGDHRTDLISSYPFRTLRDAWEHVPLNVEDHVSKGDVVIGSDVWIGMDAFITSGVTIGHGAVIGAQAVVSKDVPPYAIVVGNPGRVVRYRFDEQSIVDLLDSEWWNLPDNKVDELLPLIMGGDVRLFVAAVKEARK